MHQEPVYINPDRSPPVPQRRESEAVQVVARDGRNALIRQTKSGFLQSADYALRSVLVGDASVQRSREVWPEVYIYGQVDGEVIVQIRPVLFVPELLVDGVLSLIRQFFVGRRILAQDPRYLCEVSVGFAQERVE